MPSTANIPWKGKILLYCQASASSFQFKRQKIYMSLWQISVNHKQQLLETLDLSREYNLLCVSEVCLS